MEYCQAGSIDDLIKQSGPLDEKSVAYVLSELLLALEYLHSERKIHRDVKVRKQFRKFVKVQFSNYSLNFFFLYYFCIFKFSR